MQETFGPVVVVNTVADIKEAVRRASETAFRACPGQPAITVAYLVTALAG